MALCPLALCQWDGLCQGPGREHIWPAEGATALLSSILLQVRGKEWAVFLGAP